MKKKYCALCALFLGLIGDIDHVNSFVQKVRCLKHSNHAKHDLRLRIFFTTFYNYIFIHIFTNHYTDNIFVKKKKKK